MRGFELLDDRVVLEDTNGVSYLTDEGVVARFAAALDALRRRALADQTTLAAIDTRWPPCVHCKASPEAHARSPAGRRGPAGHRGPAPG